MLFFLRSAPEVEKRIHSKLFRKFWEEPGYKRADLHYCISSFQPHLRLVPIVAKSVKISTNNFLSQKISTKNACFATKQLREDIRRKKNVFFRALPESPNPPPLTPIRATWSFFFGRQNSRFESHLWGGEGDVLTI